jgi:hypothetical protein
MAINYNINLENTYKKAINIYIYIKVLKKKKAMRPDVAGPGKSSLTLGPIKKSLVCAGL